MSKNAKLLLGIVLIALLSIALFAMFKPTKTVTRTNPSYNGTQAKPFKHVTKPEPIISKPNYVQPKLKTPVPTPVKVLDDVIVTPTPKQEPAPCPQGTRVVGVDGYRIEPTGCHLDEQTPLEECKGI